MAKEVNDAGTRQDGRRMHEKMIKTIYSRVLWLARGTSMALGLAMMLAVVFGVGTTALAVVPGDRGGAIETAA